MNPTVVLVHGAFADASSFARLVPQLLDAGFRVLAPPVPNRSLAGDAAYLRSVLRSIAGPVVLAGHSYGSAVITVAGAESNVRALVYLCGFALREGESVAELQGRFPDAELASALVHTPYPLEGSTEPGTDLSVDIEKFPDVFAHDVDPALARVMAVSQRPLAATALAERAAVAAWRVKPSWGVIATGDGIVNPDVARFGYQRGRIRTVEIDSSHAVMLAHPEQVAGVIREAASA
ncbi:alpha/beta fold hydrolase [Paractinoplanes hotanensis]|uniref:Alpha/beta hydrolase n=1 Tax=Paractinoplanes hotanensis TaxID=2906497 RepID=A0ABT0Y6H5_9ACTN|nr:alpha/beta hydrolase [Actinoplanes hotanensis]MCM4080929.1 alpha/beta hydrolase [Actinoplanes hotanensis]